MTTREFRAIPDVNWHIRSLIAGGAIALCAFMTAISATASAYKAEQAQFEEAAIADEARLVADFAGYLAKETADARADLIEPRLKPAQRVAAVGAAPASLVDFNFSDIATAAVKAEDKRCLAQAIYYEARSEARVGQLAVADVVLNRVASRVYPNTICDVVFQGSERRTGCQFSFTCDGSMDARLNARLWAKSEALATAVLAGVRVPVTRNATHYHANYVSPPWAKTLTPTATIGTHKFYRFPSKRIKAAAPAAM